MGESFSPIISHFAFYRLCFAEFILFFFSHNTAFHHNWRIEIDLATLSWLFGHNNIKRARFISISVSYEILSEVRIFIWFFRSLTLDSHQLNYDFCCDPWLRNGSKCRDGLSRFLTLIHRNGLKIVESCLHFFQVQLLHPLESAWCVGGWHTRTPSQCDVSYVICFVSNKKRNSFMNGKKNGFECQSVGGTTMSKRRIEILMERLLPLAEQCIMIINRNHCMLLAQPAPNWFVGRFNNLWCDCFVLTDVRAYFFFVLAFEIQDEDWCSAKCHCLCRGACLNLCSARHQHTRTKLIKDRHKRGDFGGKHDRRPWQKAEADSDQKMRNKIIQHVIWNRSAARGDHLSARCHWDSFMSELNLSINVISTRARKKNIKAESKDWNLSLETLNGLIAPCWA